MKVDELEADVRPLIGRLIAEGLDVWLIGSRANELARASSDWDFIVFGTEALMDRLVLEPAPTNVDLLIVTDGESFRSPWARPSDGVFKQGELSMWKWRRVSPTTASYEGTKPPDDWGTPRKAILIEA